jgi:type II secretory pathway component GspD/PulD (secretin)
MSVVAACGDRVGYARALASLEEMRDASGQFALAAAGRPLLTRIRRLLGKPVESRFDGGWIAGMLAVAALALSLVAGRGVWLAQAQRQPETAPQTERKDSAAAFPEPKASIPAKAEVTEKHSERAVPNLSGRQFFNEQTGLLLARATVPELDTVEKAIQLVAAERPQVSIEIKFTEIDPDELPALGLDSLFDLKSAALPITITNWNGIVTDPHAFDPGKNIQDFINPKAELLAGTARVVAPAQARAILERIRGDILCAPRIITLTGQRAQAQVVEPTNRVVREQLESLPKTTSSFAFTKAAPLGSSVDLMPCVSADGLTIQLTATPWVTEFLGYDDPGPFQPASDGDGKPLVASLPLPRFRARQVTVNAVIPDGHTLVIAGFGPLEAAQPDQPNEKKKSLSKPEKQLLIFLTPTIIDARGNRVHPD